MDKLQEIKRLVDSLDVFTPPRATYSWVNPEQAAEIIEKIRKILEE